MDRAGYEMVNFERRLTDAPTIMALMSSKIVAAVSNPMAGYQ
jgi:hypothetical protein